MSDLHGRRRFDRILLLRSGMLQLFTLLMLLPLASGLRLTGTLPGRSIRASSPTMAGEDFAILWDCDGVLADTERDGHRVR